MTPDSSEPLLQVAERHLYPNYRQPPCILERGKGCEVWDTSGKRYLDLCAGVAVSALGHAHPKWSRAIAEQAGRLAHMSNYFYNEKNLRLAGELCRRTGLDRAFFCNSGTEAVEALLKLARHHFFTLGQKERYRIIAFQEAFHGRTLGALALTGRAKYREGFGPFDVGVTHVPYGDLAAVERLMSSEVAAVIVEPVQGEGGVVPAPKGFLEGLRELTQARGALLLVDEIQTGVGRTGRFLGVEHHGVVPDAVALAKGLGAGFPIGAMLCKEAFAQALPPGSHGSTFGGNPLASAAALAVLEVLDEEKLISGASTKGRFLGEQLDALARKLPELLEPERGVGLLRALPLRAGLDARPLLGRIRERGVLLTIAGDNALRFTPPLVVTHEELLEGVSVVESVLREHAAERGAQPT